MDIHNNDLIKIFEAFYRFKEQYGELPKQTLRYSIFAGIAGLERTEQGNEEIIKQSIEDFKLIATTIQEIYEAEYVTQANKTNKEINNTRKEIITLDEAIKEYNLPRRTKDPQWRNKNSNFPYHQPTGKRGNITIWRSELEEYLKTKP